MFSDKHSQRRTKSQKTAASMTMHQWYLWVNMHERQYAVLHQLWPEFNPATQADLTFEDKPPDRPQPRPSSQSIA